MGKVRAAGIYARISLDQEGTGAGVERQVADCRKLAKSLGWPVAEEYVDNDVSAYSGRVRPGYRRLLSDIASRDVDAVLCYHLDRLTRQPKELEEFLEVLDTAGVANVRFVAGDMDLGTGDGLLVARIQAAVAANSSAAKSRRVKRKLDEVAERGMPHGGSIRPFAYESDRMTVRRDEAKIFKEVVARFLAEESIRSLAIWLNDKDIPTSSGGTWNYSSLTHVITNPRYAGLRFHRDHVVGKAAWKPIISEDDHRRVLQRFEERRVTGRRANRRYLLSGMLRCGRCENRLFSSTRAEGRRYVCLSGPDHGGCGRLAVVAPPLEDLIVEAVLYRLDTPELGAALAAAGKATSELTKVTDDLADARERLEELARLFGSGKITSREWMSARTPVEATIATAERHLAKATNSTALLGIVGKGGALRRQWPTLDLGRQTAVVRTILDHAVIGPGTPGARGLDPARVHPVWRL